jgi:thioredoxin-dependent peroxiredoxin
VSYALRGDCLTRTALLLFTALATALAAPPRVGEKAPDFVLPLLGGSTVRLSDLYAKGPVALVVLRGYPGYQCPMCNRQVQDYVRRASEFTAIGVPVLLVYPGLEGDVERRAREFMADKTLPESYLPLLDPGYTFTKAYDLRWDAPNETAYPSTFLIGRDGVVFYANVSRSHGGRVSAADVLSALRKHLSKE